jgi:integrase
MDEFFTRLQQMKAVRQKKGASEKLVSTKIVQEVHKFMKAMFSCAEEWGYIKKNPCKKANRSMVKHVPQKRSFWTKDIYMEAIKYCAESEDFLLVVAMILAVGTTAREGEICGLQWDRCYISDKEIENGTCRIFIDREVTRAKKYMIEQKPQDVLYIFPDTIKSSDSSLILKIPKSDTSSRTIWLPRTVAKFLKLLKEQQQAQKAFLGSAYQNHNLVFALDDGRPIENKVLYSRFSKLISTNNLPSVVFHSIRHTSTTYKLKTTQGDIKSVQGNTGHATVQMVMDIYAEIIDQDRMTHAQTFEKDFFGNGSLLNAFGETGEVLRIETPEVLHNQDMVKVLHLLQNDPQLMNRLLSMAQAS